jgi:uncharacterized FlgJ-related protein
MIKKAQLVLAFGAALFLAGASFAAAQAAKAAPPADVDKLIELLRKDVRTGKADILAKTMALDATQSAAFWPVYKQYEAERQALGDQRLFIIQDLAEHYDTLNDANAKGLLERSFVVEEKRVALEKRYKDEFLKVLPAKAVARFFQVESRLNNLINLKLSSQIPLVY